jgi:chromosome segregation ATPase
MNNMVTKLSSVAALLGVIGAIGAGFVQYGKLTAKIEELDKRKAIINNTVDLAPMEEKIANLKVDLIDRIDAVEEQIQPVDLTLVFKEIGKVKEQIAMLPKPANTKPIYDSLKELEEYAWELEENIEELSKDVAVVKKENELQNILIEEVKALNSNPLGG